MTALFHYQEAQVDHKLNKKAFTLIEVVLAISILATMSVLVAMSLGNALKARTKIQAELQDVSGLRDAIKIMRADLYQAYNHYDFEKEILDAAKKPTPGQPVKPTLPPPWTNPGDPPARENKREDPKTDFVGDTEQVNFVTLNNGRFLANDIQADFVEVGYALKACKNLTKDTSSQCLFRRIQKIVDADVTKGGTESVLLENVKEFKLRYTGESKKDWQKDWKTVGGQDDSVKGIFPDAVEITLAIERELNGKKREYSLQYVVPLHFPNNGTKKPGGGANGTAPTPTGGQ
ncbi:general secretion pathway protein GspJ [Bdellovibrio sp. qaytius]|nr:general secretion pathway protein GspJ [Bdellovibrio sp. qaytius]